MLGAKPHHTLNGNLPKAAQLLGLLQQRDVKLIVLVNFEGGRRGEARCLMEPLKKCNQAVQASH